MNNKINNLNNISKHHQGNRIVFNIIDEARTTVGIQTLTEEI